MRPRIAILIPLVLAGCAHSAARLPVCDGRALRPANPYGSVLQGDPRTTLATPPASASPHGSCS